MFEKNALFVRACVPAGVARRRTLLSPIAVVLALSLAVGGALTHAAEQKPSTNTVAKVKFRPPPTGAPAVRLTGGSRGAGDTVVVLDVLAPDAVGLTTLEQPSLFWYQSRPTQARFELTLLKENEIKPLVRYSVNGIPQAGIHRLRLSDHGVKLALGVEYQWVVALVTDPENRSSDLVASGAIKRVEVPADLQQKIGSAEPAGLPALYAGAGMWYDSLSALSDLIDAAPGDQALQEARTDLLGQVGLKFLPNSRVAAAQ